MDDQEMYVEDHCLNLDDFRNRFFEISAHPGWFPWSLQVMETISVVTSINGKFARLVWKTIQDDTMVSFIRFLNIHGKKS